MSEAYVSISPRLALEVLVRELGSVPTSDARRYVDKRSWDGLELGAGWRDRLEELDRSASYIEWPNEFLLHVKYDEVSSWTCPDLRFEDLLRDLVRLPFDVAVGGSMMEWRRLYDARSRRYQFGEGHVQLGVAAVFSGQGHGDHLVSRRWLEHGPWARLRLEDRDLTFCVFYDPDLTESEEDMALAVEQAWPGHERMGISAVGGYLHDEHDYEGPIEGTYLTEQRRFIRVVHGREVSQREMMDAAAFRRDSRGTDTPIERYSYVFMEEAVARSHLHELWLRELECYAIIDGREVRLDADYAPERTLPTWAVAVEAKWQPVLKEVAGQG